MVQVAGKPFLEYVLSFLAGHGIQEVILCVGELDDQIRLCAGDGQKWGLHIRYSEEREPLGTAGALHRATRGLNHPFYALNGDMLFMADLQALWQEHEAAWNMATLALLPRVDGREWSCVTLDEKGQVLSIQREPAAQDVLINPGLYVIEPEALWGMISDQEISLERDIFSNLARQSRLGGQVQAGYFVCVEAPDLLAGFERDLVMSLLPAFCTPRPQNLEVENRFLIAAELASAVEVLQRLAAAPPEAVGRVGKLVAVSFQAGNKVLAFGSGASAVCARQFADELMGSCRLQKRAMPAVALDAGLSASPENGEGQASDAVFARQVQALTQLGDVVVGISASGRSSKVIAGLQAARQRGAHTVAVAGADASLMSVVADEVIQAPSTDPRRIREAQQVLLHVLCSIIQHNLDAASTAQEAPASQA